MNAFPQFCYAIIRGIELSLQRADAGDALTNDAQREASPDPQK